MSLVDAIARAKQDGSFDRLIEAIPYLRFVGIAVRAQNDGLVTQMAYQRSNIGNRALPALHGGTIAALLESAAVFELVWRTELAALPKPITLTIDYRRSGKAADTFARARVTRQGRRVANVYAEAWQDDPDRPIATANVHLLIGE